MRFVMLLLAVCMSAASLPAQPVPASEQGVTLGKNGLSAPANPIVRATATEEAYYSALKSLQKENVTVAILESRSITPGHVMDTVWAHAARLLGYNPSILPQVTLDDTAFFAGTDILIVSSGIIDIPANRAHTLLRFIRSGKSVYFQNEYDCMYSTNILYGALVDSLGGKFSRNGIRINDLAPVSVLGVLSTTPNKISTLNYFYYGCHGTGDSPAIVPFIQFMQYYFGFIFTPVTTECGKMIMTTDQDWIREYAVSGGLPLLQNILTMLRGCVMTVPVRISALGPTSFCEGGGVELEAETGFVSYTWSNGSHARKIRVTAPGSYSVQVTDGSCCRGRSDAIAVTVVAAPKPVVRANGATVLCDAGSVELDAGTGYASYVWSTGASTQKIVVTVTGKYFVTVTDFTGCTGVSDTITVSHAPQPTPVVTPIGSTVFCEGDSVLLDAGSGFSSYAWSNAATTRTIKVKSAGTYFVTVTDANGCTGRSQSLTITIFPKPLKPVIVRTRDSLISSSATGYQWYNSASPIAGAVRQHLEIPGSGTYRVRITDGNGCTAESDPYDVVVTVRVATTLGLGCPLRTTFNAGEPVAIPLILSGSANLTSGISQYTAYVRYNQSVLSPRFPFQSAVTNGNERTVAFTSARSSAMTQGTLLDLPFTVMLGDAECASVHLDSVVWLGGNVRVTLDNPACEICVNVCREGGTRLFSSTGKVQLFQNRPNPFNGMTVLEYEVIEKAPARLIIVDMLGRTLATLVDGPVAQGRYLLSFDAAALPSGTYIAVLQTPTHRVFRMMEVLK